MAADELGPGPADAAPSPLAPLPPARDRLPDSEDLPSALAATQRQLLLYAADLREIVAQERARRRDLERAFLDTVAVLAAAVEARDPYTGGHAERVAAYAAALAEVLDWPKALVDETRYGGLLHDIGKLGVDDQVLRKPGRLEEAEWEQMRRHPELGARILLRAPVLSRSVVYARYHHERWDGHGYPDGLADVAIPAGGRLMALADAYDAMTSTRPYRPAMDPEQAAIEVARCAGTQFDPEMAHAFLQALRDGRIPSRGRLGAAPSLASARDQAAEIGRAGVSGC